MNQSIPGNLRLPAKPRLSCAMIPLAILSMGLSPANLSAAELIFNGDFDANASSFGTFPGYFGGANPASAPNWSGGSGINGTDAPGTGNPFAPVSNVPHFLFMQGTAAEQSITTTPGELHVFAFDAAARNGNTAGLSIFADNTQPASLIMSGAGAPSYGWLNPAGFERFAFAFTGTGAQTIRFASSGVGDFTSDIDKVSITNYVGTIPVATGLTFFTEATGTHAYNLQLTGTNNILFQRAGAPVYTGNVTTDGSAGSVTLRSFGRQAGAHNLTFSGTIILGDKSLETSGQNGGNVDSIGDANGQMTTLSNATLTTNSNVTVTRSALEIKGTSTATIGGSIISGNAWNSLILRDSAVVNTTGGVDFRNVASNLQLSGGSLYTPSIWGNTTFGGASRTIFDGTHIYATANNSDFLKVSNDFDGGAHSGRAEISPGGAILDTNGFAITIQNDLRNVPGQTGGLSKLGAGTLTLTAVAAYTGPTSIQQGTLKLSPHTPTGGSVAIGNSGFETPDVGPGGFQYAPGGATWGFAGSGIAQNGSPWFSPNAVEGVQGGFIQNGGNAIAQNVTVPASGLYDLTFKAVSRHETPPNGLRIYLDGQLVREMSHEEFSQTAWGTYTVPIALTAGGQNLRFEGFNTHGAGDVSTVIDDVSITNGRTGGGSVGGTTQVSISGGATLDLGGNHQAIGSLSGSGLVTSSVASSSTLTIGTLDSASTTFAGVIENGSGTMSLTKIGRSSLNLTGASTYTGTTDVQHGTLFVNGSITSSSVTVGAPATLGGAGVINSPVSISGTLSPGNSPGDLTINGSVAFNPGSTFAVEISTVASFDQLTIGSGGSLGSNNGAFSLTLGYAPAMFDSFMVVENLSAGTLAPFSNLADGSIISADFGGTPYQFIADYEGGTGNDLILTAIPESTTAILILVGGSSLLTARRKNR